MLESDFTEHILCLIDHDKASGWKATLAESHSATDLAGKRPLHSNDVFFSAYSPVHVPEINAVHKVIT